MKKRYALPITSFISVAIALTLPAIDQRVKAGTFWRLTTSAVARQSSTKAPQFSPPPRVLGKNYGRRIFLIHGLPGYANYWDAPERQTLLDALLRDGAQVVILRLPNAEQSYFADGGAGYCRAFADWFDRMAAEVTEKYGPAEEFTAGISYGGYHAMLAAQLPRVAGWVAISPVTDISRLAEFRFQSNGACRPNPTQIGRKPGLMIFGAHDERVGTDLMKLTAASIERTHPANFSAVVMEAPNHATTPEISERVASWYGDRR